MQNIELSPAEIEMIKIKREQAEIAKREQETKTQLTREKEVIKLKLSIEKFLKENENSTKLIKDNFEILKIKHPNLYQLTITDKEKDFQYETLNELDEFSYDDGNPFLIKIGTKQYFVFLKNLSPAYFKNSPDVTRIQLPYSDHFSKIFKADIPFIILGYDVDTDTVVSWNPQKIKERLNAKSNVSLYSRYMPF